jgi:hypothetical protein
MGWVGSWFWISATRRVIKSLGFRPLVEFEELVDVELLVLLVFEVAAYA